LLESIGLVLHKLKLKGDLELEAENLGLNNGVPIQRLLEEISTELEILPGLEYFEEMPKSCKADSFFEALTMKIKTMVLAEQQKIFSTQNSKKIRLTRRLECLKKEYMQNAAEIFRVEHELSQFTESLLRDEVENMGIFNRLNNEKITPYFVGLANRFRVQKVRHK
jgi:hypothetical protein